MTFIVWETHFVPFGAPYFRIWSDSWSRWSDLRSALRKNPQQEHKRFLSVLSTMCLENVINQSQEPDRCSINTVEEVEEVQEPAGGGGAGGCSHTETSSSVQIASRWGWEMSLRWCMTLLLLKHTVGVLETHEATGRDGLYSVTWCWEWRESRLFCQVRVSFL